MSLAAQAAVTDREHRTMNTVKAPALQASLPTPSADAGALELSQRDHTVLPRSDFRDDGVRVGIADFCTHVGA
jgi:hypothetical protein